MVVPDLSIFARVGDTVVVVPDSGGWALTGPSVLIPDHASITVLDDCAELVVPLGSRRADAFVGGTVPGLSSSTEHTIGPIVVESFRAVTLESLLIPFLSAAASRLHHALSSIPEVTIRA